MVAFGMSCMVGDGIGLVSIGEAMAGIDWVVVDIGWTVAGIG